MKQLTNWFKTAVTTILDPDRESRIKGLVSAIHRAIQKHQTQFTIEQALIGRDHSDQDIREAKERVYRGALERAWGDNELSASEQKTAKWLSASLKLTSEDARLLDLEQARKVFGLVLSKAMEDGVLEPAEERRLKIIASTVGCELSQFARTFFEREGEAFLRSMFLACIADSHISQAEWDHLLHVARQFGLQPTEMLSVVQPQARQFVEHVLADAKSNGSLSSLESQTLSWLVDHLHLPSDFRVYVVQEMRVLQALTNIGEGRLPSVSMPPGMEHRSGEIVHWVGNVTWREHRRKRDGLHALDHGGVLAMTDNRLVFSSELKSQSISYRKIVAHTGTDSWFQIQFEGKPVSQFLLRVATPIPYAIFRMAVAMANQTKVARLEGGNTRHIPRDVRQRVWQRYGARCAECDATAYLEFDHIIPVARGGSNTDSNVQLLCRNCNLKKSDHI